MGTLTSWNPLGHFRPVMGLLYLYLVQEIQIVLYFSLFCRHGYGIALANGLICIGRLRSLLYLQMESEPSSIMVWHFGF